MERMSNKEYVHIRTALVPRACDEIDMLMRTDGKRERDGVWSERFLKRMDELAAEAIKDFEARVRDFEKKAKGMRAALLAEVVKTHK